MLYITVMSQLHKTWESCSVVLEDSGVLGCDIMSLGKRFSVFSRKYNPLKQWNHLPNDTEPYPRRPEHSCLNLSGGYVEKQMIGLQFLTVLFTAVTATNISVTHLRQWLLKVYYSWKHSSQCLTVVSSLNTTEIILHKLHQSKKMKM